MIKYVSIVLIALLLVSSCIFPAKPTPAAPGGIVSTTGSIVQVRQGGTGTTAWTAGAIPYISATTSNRMSEVSTATTGWFIEWNGTAPVYASVGTVGGYAVSATYTGSSTINAVGTLTAGTWNGTSIGYLYEGTRTSAQESDVLTDETGTGLVVYNTSPTITTPNISAPVITGSTSMGLVTSGTWQGSSVAFTYLQLARGDTFIPDGITTVAVTHNLGTTPIEVFLTWQSQPLSSSSVAWVSDKGATTFQINIGAVSGTPWPTIAWLAIP